MSLAREWAMAILFHLVMAEMEKEHWAEKNK
jgi:hypothetical protein